MTPTILLGAASALMRSKKAKLALVGIQFGYLAFRLIKERKRKKSQGRAQQ